MLFAFFCAAVTSAGSAGATVVSHLRTGRPDDRTSRLVFEVAAAPDYHIYYLDNPRRIVVDVKNGDISKFNKDIKGIDVISDMRAGLVDGDIARFVFDLSSPRKITRPLVLPPGQNYAYHRFLIDLIAADSAEFAKLVSDKKSFISTGFGSVTDRGTPFAPDPPPPPRQPSAEPKKSDKIIIVIDPGHGGHDPGTIGSGGTNEKDITLSVSRQLRALLAKNPRYHVLMTREKDEFVALRDRPAFGEKAGAHLFISIHVNSSPRLTARGFSIYTLNEKASDEESLRVAKAENAAGLTGIGMFEEYDPVMKNILGDIFQNRIKEESVKFGLEVVGKMRSGSVQCLEIPKLEAPFTVLRSTVPSVLVELGFMSNRDEEKLLKTSKHQDRLVRAISAAVDNFFKD